MRIALYQGKSLISRLIRWQTRSQYSHAAFLLDNGSVIEAWQPCVREIYPAAAATPETCHISALSRQHTPGTRVDVYKFISPLNNIENWRLETAARNDVGKGYDYRGILRFLTRQRDPKSRRLFCSEQVFARCQQIGRPLLDRTEAWRVPPDWIGRSPHLAIESTITTS